MLIQPAFFTITINWRTEVVAWAIDVAISLLGLGAAISSGIEVYKLAKIGRVYLRENISKALKKAALGVMVGVVECIFALLDKITDLGSIGGIIANAFDLFDGKLDGYIKYKIKLW